MKTLMMLIIKLEIKSITMKQKIVNQYEVLKYSLNNETKSIIRRIAN